MNKTMPEKCPKCGAARHPCSNGSVVWYDCGYSIAIHLPDGDHESVQCIINQRDQLAERVNRLREAGDRMAAELNRQCAPDWEDSLARLWRLAKSSGRPVDQAEASACAVIQDERRDG